MKTRIILLFALLFTVSFTYGQGLGIGKLGISNLANRTINLEYERNLTPKTAVNGELSLRIPSGLPNAITKLFVGDATKRDINIFTSTYNHFGLEGSYRIYTAQKAPHGFYYAPYIKVGRHSFDLTGDFDNQDKGIYDQAGAAEGALTVVSVGTQIGYQFIVNNKFTINWNFIGLGVGTHHANVTYTSDYTAEFNEWKADVEKFLEEDLLTDLSDNFTITADAPNKMMNAKGSAIFPTVRMSISVGYMF